MCLIVHRTKGSLPTEIVRYNLNYNPDGFGVAWRKDGELVYSKFAPSDWREFADLLAAIDDKDGEYVAHFRKATHGDPCKDLSHPIPYKDPKGNSVLLFHNGIIDIDTPKDGSESDTSMFAKHVLAKLPPRWWAKPHLRYLVSEAIGWSKLILMTKTETVRIREEAGETSGGIWYSTAPLGYSSYTTGTGMIGASGTSYNSSTKPYALPEGRGRVTRIVTPMSAVGDVLKSKGPDKDTPGTYTWWLKGLDGAFHEVYSFGQIVTDGDYEEGTVTCSDCDTEGEFFIIDGKSYVNIAHEDYEDEYATCDLPAGYTERVAVGA